MTEYEINPDLFDEDFEEDMEDGFEDFDFDEDELDELENGISEDDDLEGQAYRPPAQHKQFGPDSIKSRGHLLAISLLATYLSGI